MNRYKSKKALEVDPSVYEFDEVYDDMKNESEQSQAKKPKQTKSLYIEKLMKAAEERRIAQEMRLEKKLQKEREEEGDQFSDKPTFVTSAYKQKLLERQKFAENERKQDAIDEMFDVRKQADLSGFYKHLLNDTASKVRAEKESKEAEARLALEALRAKSSSSGTRSMTARNFRNRASSESDEEVKIVKKSRDRSPRRKRGSKKAKEDTQQPDEPEKSSEQMKESEQPVEPDPIRKTPVNDEDKKIEDPNESIETENTPPVLRKSRAEKVAEMLRKRTIGDVLEAAKQRYFERKEAES